MAHAQLSMEVEEFRPALKEVVLAYGVASVLIWATAAGIILLLGLPQAYIVPLIQVSALVSIAYFAIRSAQTLWLRLTEHYFIGDGLVSKRGGWVTKYSVEIQLNKVVEVQVITPLLLKVFGVGHVLPYTLDRCGCMLRNVKDPRRIAKKMQPGQAGEPMFRPIVG